MQTTSLTRPAAALAMLLLMAMAGCTSQIADLAEPADAPPRPAVEPAYPAVHDMPAARDTKPMTAAERQRLADELSAARERQEAETAEPAQPKKATAR
jgi:hypothetical protein